MQIKKIFFLLVFGFPGYCFFFPHHALSQQKNADADANNAVFIEFLGNGGYYSVNYDRLFPWGELFAISTRAGFAFVPFQYEDSDQNYISHRYPLELNGLVGHEPYYFEMGLGYTPYYKQDGNFGHVILWRIGLRYQNNNPGVFIRAGFTPEIYEEEFLFHRWGGFSVGINF